MLYKNGLNPHISALQFHMVLLLLHLNFELKKSYQKSRMLSKSFYFFNLVVC